MINKSATPDGITALRRDFDVLLSTLTAARLLIANTDYQEAYWECEKAIRHTEDLQAVVLASLPSERTCPHCQLPAVLPEGCTPEVNDVINQEIAKVSALFEAGYELGIKSALPSERKQTTEEVCTCRHDSGVSSVCDVHSQNDGARYFVHVKQFLDGTAYIRVDADGKVWIHSRTGRVTAYTHSTIEKCLKKVTEGKWREVDHGVQSRSRSLRERGVDALASAAPTAPTSSSTEK